MKKFILSALAGITFCAPVLSQSESFEPIDIEKIIIPEYSYAAMGCMKLGKCSEGVYKIKPGDYDGELADIIENLNKMGVEVYEAVPEYFVDEYRAVYYSDKNLIFLNMGFMNSDEKYLETLRHEGWHAAQDCMAGGMHNSDILSILDHELIPSHIIDETFTRYGYNDPSVIRIEREAVWAMYEPKMTVNALESCNSDTPMWETYFPPKRTWSYLYWNGFIEVLPLKYIKN